MSPRRKAHPALPARSLSGDHHLVRHAQEGLDGFIAMVAYVIAGPDGTQAPRPVAQPAGS